MDILYLTGGERGWTASRLAGHFGISRRRLFDDLQVLHEAGFPLLADRSGYRPLRPVPNLPVTLSPREVLAMLLPLRDAGEARATAQRKLAASLPPPLRDLFFDPKRITAPVHSSGAPEAVCEGVERALAENRTLRLRYQGIRDRQAKDRIVEPHALFMKGSGWYLAAWAPEAGDFRLFRLDRLQEAELLSECFVPREEFDVNEYAGRSSGVWKGEALDACVEVLPSHVVSVRSEALSRGMEFRMSGEKGMVEIPHGNVDELTWWLASFGEGVRVLKPERLRARLAALGRRIVELNGR